MCGIEPETHTLDIAPSANNEYPSILCIDSLPYAMSLQNIALEYINSSHAFAQALGLERHEIIGKFSNELPSSGLGKTLHALSSRVAATGREETCVCTENTQGCNYVVSSHLHTEPTHGVRAVMTIIIEYEPPPLKISESRLNKKRRLLSDLFRAQEDEKLRFSRDLHDEIGQWLVTIRAKSQAIFNTTRLGTRTNIIAKEIAENAVEMQKSMRAMLKQLRPPMLNELGLADSLHELGAQWKKSNPDIRLKLNINAEHSLGDQVDIAIYRVIQESLTNISKHANATSVTIELWLANGFVLVDIKDNGSGFSRDLDNEGLGILGMRERVFALYGEFHIKERSPSGTEIRIAIPIAT